MGYKINKWNHIFGSKSESRKKVNKPKLVRYSLPIAFIHSELVSCVLPVLDCGVKYQNPWPFRAESGSPRHFFWGNGHF